MSGTENYVCVGKIFCLKRLECLTLLWTQRRTKNVFIDIMKNIAHVASCIRKKFNFN